MPFEFPEYSPPGGGDGGPYGNPSAQLNRGGLLYELGGGAAGSGSGPGGFYNPPGTRPPPQLPQLGMSGRGGGMVPGSWGFSGGTPDAYAGGDPWQAEFRRRYGGGQTFGAGAARVESPFPGGGGGGGAPSYGGGGGAYGGFDPTHPNNPGVNPWGAGGGQGWNAGQYETGGLYGGGPFVQFRSDQPGSISAQHTLANLLMGGGAGTMFDPTGNYAPYLDSLQGDLNRNTGAMLDRTRLRASLDPNIDPSQRGYAGLVGESSAFGGAQDVLSGARRGMADRNQQYLMEALRALYETQTGGQANPYVDWNLQSKYARQSQPEQNPWVAQGGQALQAGASALPFLL